MRKKRHWVGEVFLDCVDDKDDDVVVAAEEKREGEVVGAL